MRSVKIYFVVINNNRISKAVGDLAEFGITLLTDSNNFLFSFSNLLSDLLYLLSFFVSVFTSLSLLTNLIYQNEYTHMYSSRENSLFLFHQVNATNKLSPLLNNNKNIQHTYIIKSNHFINNFNTLETILLGLSDSIRITSTRNTKGININRHIIDNTKE